MALQEEKPPISKKRKQKNPSYDFKKMSQDGKPLFVFNVIELEKYDKYSKYDLIKALHSITQMPKMSKLTPSKYF